MYLIPIFCPSHFALSRPFFRKSCPLCDQSAPKQENGYNCTANSTLPIAGKALKSWGALLPALSMIALIWGNRLHESRGGIGTPRVYAMMLGRVMHPAALRISDMPSAGNTGCLSTRGRCPPSPFDGPAKGRELGCAQTKNPNPRMLVSR